MAKMVALEGPALAWAREEFRRYYATTPIAPPPRLERREFAAFPFLSDPAMRRHTTLRTAEEFRRFLLDEVPRHVYYSTAYYRLPAEPTMAGKEWLGADLLFDLDADHLRGAERLDYAGQLALVKARLLDLVDDFLLGDFGIAPEELTFVFSGGRGYHVHVRDSRFLPLTSPERRELVDYIQGTGFDARRAVAPRHLTVGGDGEDGPRRRATLRQQQLPSPEDPGWRGRTARAVLALLARWETTGASEADLGAWGISKSHARKMTKLLFAQGGATKIRTSRTLDALPEALQQEFLEAVVPRAAVEVQGETDAPVTTDVHRLIRLPGSLHGGTGFRVLPISRPGLEAFDPLRDAPIPARDGARVAVVFEESVHYPWGEGSIDGTPGGEARLPTPAALFLVLRGEASLRP